MNRNFALLFLFAVWITFISCGIKRGEKLLVFKDYPKLKIGFSTQNFQKALPLTIESMTEMIGYASKEGYQFIEIRDDLAKLSAAECNSIAEVARKYKIQIIYEIHKNLLDSGYVKVFERGLANTLLFSGPGILRTLVSKSEFEADTRKKGWTKDELNTLTKLSDSCALIARTKNIQFIVENLNEPFFGDGLNYYGITDFFSGTSATGLQLDISNPFRSSSRAKAVPDKVKEYLPSLGNRWIVTHLKTVPVLGGEPQPTLTDNPLPVETVVKLMGQQNVLYAALELSPVSDKQQCFINHDRSIQFLKDKGIISK